MQERQSPTRRAYPLLATLAFLGLGLAGCEQTPVQPSPSELTPSSGLAAQVASSGAEVVPLVPLKQGVEGTSTLHRRQQGFTVRVEATGLSPGHAVTLWATDLQAGRTGRVAGGIVGGAGSVNLSGNNCVHPTPDGFVPGTPPVCDLIDPLGDIRFTLLESDEPWTPGDQSARWTPAGKPPAAMADHLVAP
jgi:hypothetical protein